MLLQGNLQAVFDVLYSLGVIDPVLDMDWTEEMKEIGTYHKELSKAVKVVNRFQKQPDQLMNHLGQFENKVLNFLAMEVAREFADFHAREQLH